MDAIRTYAGCNPGSTAPAAVARRDRLLAELRENGAGTITELEARMTRRGEGIYGYGTCARDLNALATFGLIRHSGHPKVWTAVEA